MERRKGTRIRFWLEIIGSIAGIVLAVIAYTEYAHSRVVETMNAQHADITAVVKVETDARVIADAQLEKEVASLSGNVSDLVKLNTDQIKSLSRLASEMKIALNKLGLDGSE